MSSKRKLDAFVTRLPAKRIHLESDGTPTGEGKASVEETSHPTYPFPVPHLSDRIAAALTSVPAAEARAIHDQPYLDLLYFQPFVPKSIERELFEFYRSQLFFYRVQYKIKRGLFETEIHTPRYTTVFGVDSSAEFDDGGRLVDSQSKMPVPKDRWNCTPRPLPQCLDHLRKLTEIFTGAEYNFCLVNYYASGVDSISYHSDDERFLGPDPAIASFSLGATRDFCMKHKSSNQKTDEAQPEQPQKPPLKFPLSSGDMVLMRGKTQSQWLHSIPKRKGKGSEGGRINITFRKGVKPYATENYMQYNIGQGCVWKWDSLTREMKEWKG